MAGRLGNSKRRLGDDYLSLHDKVIEELRQAILSRRLKPGERLVEGRLALQRVQALISTGHHVREQVAADHGLPNKRSLDAAVAPSATYRLGRKADVLALYQSAKAAWRDGVEGLFQLAE